MMFARNAVAGPSKLARVPRQRRDRRGIVTSLFPQPPVDHRRLASTSTTQTDWLAWLKKAALQRTPDDGSKALLFAGLVSMQTRPGR